MDSIYSWYNCWELCFASLIIFHKTHNPTLIIRKNQTGPNWETQKILGQWEFPGGLMVRIPGFSWLSLPWPRFNPWSGNWDPASHTTWPKKPQKLEKNNTWPILLIIVTKNKESLRNCHSQDTMTKCNVISWVEPWNRKRTLDKN